MGDVAGGYKALTPIQVCNALAAYDAGAIHYGTLRTFFACAAALASTEAAARSRSPSSSSYVPGVNISVEAVGRVLGAKSLAFAAQEIRRLERLGILTRNRLEKMVVAEEPIEGTASLLEKALMGRSPRRPIPFPRRVLRFLAKCPRPTLLKCVVAHCLRALTIDRETGGIKHRGAMKASWVADTFGVSLRAAKASRARLIAIGLISRDAGSTQRKLNRDGAYFALNLAWEDRPSSAPLPLGAVGDFAPPIERHETPYRDLENQKAPSGLKEPSLKDIRAEDLCRLTRMEVLFWEAKRLGWISGSEMDAINMLAASIRARGVDGGDAVRIFAAIVRRGLWSHITCEEEDEARRVLARYREGVPQAFRPPQSGSRLLPGARQGAPREPAHVGPTSTCPTPTARAAKVGSGLEVESLAKAYESLPTPQDEMVDQRNPQEPSRLDEPSREGKVLGARLRVPARVVVGHDDCRRPLPDSRPEDLSGVDEGAREGTPRDLHEAGDQMPAAQQQGDEHLYGLVSKERVKETRHLRSTPHALTVEPIEGRGLTDDFFQSRYHPSNQTGLAIPPCLGDHENLQLLRHSPMLKPSAPLEDSACWASARSWQKRQEPYSVLLPVARETSALPRRPTSSSQMAEALRPWPFVARRASATCMGFP